MRRGKQMKGVPYLREMDSARKHVDHSFEKIILLKFSYIITLISNKFSFNFAVEIIKLKC